MHKRRGSPSEYAHRPRHETGNVLGAVLAEPFRYDFTDDNREIGHHDNHDRGGGDVGGFVFEALGLQPYRKRLGENGFTDNAVEQADRGDADLHG